MAGSRLPERTTVAAMTKRRVLIMLTAAMSAAAITNGGTAMATKGSCDPAPDLFNVQTLSKGNGTVTIDIRYGWDGVSAYPDCQGPLIRVRVTNTGAQTWYAHLQGRRGQPRTVAIEPGAARNYTGTQLASVGLETVDDISDLTLTTTP
jgi:hypothetical protein